MRNGIIYLTFIPWILFYSSAVKNSIMYLKNIEFNFYWLKNNIFKAFHFKDLILYGILFYFTSSYYKSSQIWLVSILLFTMINLYLFINSFYDKHRSNEKITSKDLSLIIVISLISLIPIIFYVFTRKYIVTYYILLAFNFLNFIIVALSKMIIKFLTKIFSSNKNE